MNMFLLILVICGTIYQLEADSTSYSYGANLKGQNIGDLLKSLNQGNPITGKQSSFSAALGRSYGKNTLLKPNRTPTTNRFPGPLSNLLHQNGGINYGNLNGANLWNRPTIRPTVTGSNDEVDPEVAQQFPDLVNLLNNLKELNKLKDEGKLPFGTNKPTNGQIIKPIGNGENNGNNKPNDYGDETNYKPGGIGNTNIIVISDGQAYFQAQPVVPEDERKKVNETIYYVKS